MNPFSRELSRTAAEVYEHDLVPAMSIPWATWLVTLAEPALGATILDIACGTGVVTRRAAQQVGATGMVIGIDINAEMLSVARSMIRDRGLPLGWLLANAEALPFPSASFDVVLCLQGLQFFPDKAQALREMQRVLRPNGRVALGVWGPLAQNPATPPSPKVWPDT